MTSDLGLSAMLRILCLGNELLADDAFGPVVAEGLRRAFPHLDVVFTTDSGLDLLEYLTETDLLVVVDTIQTGKVPTGTLYVAGISDIKTPLGPSPHYIGLLEALQVAKELLLKVPGRCDYSGGRGGGLLDARWHDACCGASRCGTGD